MRRGDGGETVSHAAILSKLEAVEVASEKGHASIRRQLRNGSARFDKIEEALEPFTKLVEQMGGPEQFEKNVLDGLKALGWFGRVAKRTLLLVITVGGALTALKVLVTSMWKGGL